MKHTTRPGGDAMVGQFGGNMAGFGVEDDPLHGSVLSLLPILVGLVTAKPCKTATSDSRLGLSVPGTVEHRWRRDQRWLVIRLVRIIALRIFRRQYRRQWR